MSLARGPLFVLHMVFATVVVISLFIYLQEREAEVSRIKQLAHQEHQETARLQSDITQQDELIKGLRQKDPYVVEMIARDKFKYAGAGEIAPPPLPSIDKQRAIGSK
jgi:cell division protein FtsB